MTSQEKKDLRKRINHGWNISAEGFSNFITEDLSNTKKKIWYELLLEQVPREGKLNILDVGTGPGFFAILLSMAGHNVVGIDASEEMIKEATKNASDVNVNPEFLLMDSQRLTFADETFDMIVNRNVVWTLDRPKSAYSCWYRALKKGGRLVVFDGDWLADCRDDEIKQQRARDREEYVKKYGEPQVSYSDNKYEMARGWRVDLPLAKEERPKWDINTLNDIGFRNVNNTFIYDRVCDAKEKILYKNCSIFMLTGDKIY